MTRLTYRVHGTDRADDWRDFGACRGVDPELFFTEGKGQQVQLREAQAVCWGCPVRQQCGEYAIAAGEYWGIWGGMTQSQLRTARNRRKQAAA
ncbi:WhiB family transcriptional regulator [Streptomyces flaveolus]|uniref:WhiB family transcriptional regulator n=1 Tax=Streptomyces flaveolus TaxID=67297 RepID=UPI003406CB4E